MVNATKSAAVEVHANAALFPKETEVIGHLEPEQEPTHG